jgi:hypothetical protein
LIQNADDADGAIEMAFDVRDDALVVVNNGFFTDCDDQDSPDARGWRNEALVAISTASDWFRAALNARAMT